MVIVLEAFESDVRVLKVMDIATVEIWVLIFFQVTVAYFIGTV